MRRFTKTRAAIAVLAASAIVAPSAGARPIDYPLAGGINAGVGPTEVRSSDTGIPAPTGRPGVPVTRTVEAPSSGFDWGDAGLGAAGMLSLLGLGAGAVVIARRRGQPAIG